MIVFEQKTFFVFILQVLKLFCYLNCILKYTLTCVFLEIVKMKCNPKSRRRKFMENDEYLFSNQLTSDTFKYCAGSLPWLLVGTAVPIKDDINGVTSAWLISKRGTLTPLIMDSWLKCWKMKNNQKECSTWAQNNLDDHILSIILI